MTRIKLELTNGLVRGACALGLIGIAICYYQFVYAPFERSVQENLTLASQSLEKLSQQDKMQNRYRVLNERFRQELNQKGIKERERWQLESGKELVDKLNTCFASHPVVVDVCQQIQLGKDDNTLGEFVHAEFHCDLKNLFHVLTEIDLLPPNVNLLQFELDESRDGQRCRVSIDFGVDLSHVNQEPNSAEQALIP